MKFRKKPVEIDAIQFIDGNSVEIANFIIDGGGSFRAVTHPRDGSKDEIFIQTLEGEMKAINGDWVIKGIKGEFYPCKPDVFEATYEAV